MSNAAGGDARAGAPGAGSESEGRFRRVYDALPQAIALFDEGDRILHANPALLRLTGSVDGEVVGRRVAALWDAPATEVVLPALAKARATGAPHETLVEAAIEEGGRRSFRVRWIPLHDESGAVREVMAVVEEVTERFASERRVEESERQYRMLVENMDDVVFTLDGEGVFTFVSSGIAHYGLAPQDVIGQPFTKFLHADDIAAQLGRWGQAEAGRRATADVRVIDGTGKVRFVRGMARPVLSGDRLVAVQGILTDMTQQREMEAQLRTAQKMEAVGRLAGGIAHDFNNLLMVIGSYTELAMDSLPPETPVREDLEEVRKASLRATRLTRQLLAFSRKQVLRPEVIDLNTLVGGMEKMLRRLLGEDVQLVFAPGASLGATLADAGQLEQVLMNLAVNARDAMPHGGSLRIATSNAEVDHEYASYHLGLRPGSWVKITVTDTGTGMDEATLARIFDPFFTTKAAGKGTGLGLAMVYGIVVQSGGGVWVKSRPGLGTTFEIFLPRASESRPEEARDRGSSAEPRAPAVAEGILLVEDDDAVRKLTQRMLVAAGHPVVCAATGAEALKLLANDKVDARLLVTDVVLPGLNGRELWERLEKLRPGLRVLYISGYTDEAISERAGLEPGGEILCKPFSADVLLRNVRAVLDRE